MASKVAATSKSPRGRAGPSRAREFNLIKFLGVEQQDRCEALKSRRFLFEKPFIFNSHGKYRGFAQIIEERGWGKLIDHVRKLNYDVVREFYSNAVPRKGEPFKFESYVRGKMVQFDRDAINDLLGKPSGLEITELDAFTHKLGRHRDFDAMASILLQEGRKVQENNVGVPMRYAREDMTTEAQVFLLLVLYNIKPKFHHTTAPIDLEFLVFSILYGTEIDVVGIIANELRLTMENYRQTGGKNPSPLLFPSLITSLCLSKGVNFHTSISITNLGAIDDDHIEWFYVPKGKKRSGGEISATATEAGGLSAGSYDPRQMEMCNYSWDMMEAQQRSCTQLHASMENLQLQF